MKLEGHIYCEGPECEHHSHIGPDRFNRSGKITSLPPGFVRVIEYDSKGADDHVFCGYDCLMKWCAQFPPEETIPLHDEPGATDG